MSDVFIAYTGTNSDDRVWLYGICWWCENMGEYGVVDDNSFKAYDA